jgi:hypothetical protein
MLELLLLFVLGVFSAPITEQLQRECNLVREAYLAVRPSWSTTTIPEDCRNWSEIVTDDYSIRTIKFYYFNGKTFPNQLLELKNVTRVDITNVGFEGVFPSNMSWPLLETLYFGLT